MSAAAHIVLTEVKFRLKLATCVNCTVMINWKIVFLLMLTDMTLLFVSPAPQFTEYMWTAFLTWLFVTCLLILVVYIIALCSSFNTTTFCLFLHVFLVRTTSDTIHRLLQNNAAICDLQNLAVHACNDCHGLSWTCRCFQAYVFGKERGVPMYQRYVESSLT
jgi:hypothetical protein